MKIRKAITASTLTLVALGTLGSLAPAQATPPCVDCVIQGAAEGVHWWDPDAMGFYGTIVGTMIRPSTREPIYIIGTVSGSASIRPVRSPVVVDRPVELLDDLPTLQTNAWPAYTGAGSMTVSMSMVCASTCTHIPRREATFDFTVAGNVANWTMAGVGNTVLGNMQLLVPHYSGTSSGAPRVTGGIFAGGIAGTTAA